MKLTKQRIREIIKEEIETMNEEPVQEGIENITPENMELVMQALKKLVMSPYTGPIIVAAFASVGVATIKDLLSGSGGTDDVE
jgi:hypothetical protein